MVDGVIGYLDNAVRHVMVDYEVSIESVTIPNLCVMVNSVKVRALHSSQENAMTFVVMVRT